MNNLLKKPLFWTNVAAVTLTGLVIAGVAFGWNSPLAAPTGGSGAIVTDLSGNVGIGIAAPTQKLDVAGNVKGTGLCIGSDCRAAWPTFSGITGLGTANYLPKFTSGNAIGNSQVFDNGTNVGIGNAAPTQKLDVTGNANISGTIRGATYGFGGIYVNHVGVGGFTTCSVANPFTNACNCPTGFTAKLFSYTGSALNGSINDNPTYFCWK